MTGMDSSFMNTAAFELLEFEESRASVNLTDILWVHDNVGENYFIKSIKFDIDRMRLKIQIIFF